MTTKDIEDIRLKKLRLVDQQKLNLLNKKLYQQ